MERSYKFFYIICLVFISFLLLSSKSQCQYGFPYSSYGGYWLPQYYQPYPDFSNWIWINPTTAYNPYTPPGLNQMVLISWVAGQEWRSPYFQQIGYPFGYAASPFPWPTNLPGVYHPLGTVLNWPWNQAFDVIMPWGPLSLGQWSPYIQGGNLYSDGLYSPLGIPPSSYDQYGPMFMLGYGWINPYQIIPNPLSMTGFSMFIPDYGLWPPSMVYAYV